MKRLFLVALLFVLQPDLAAQPRIVHSGSGLTISQVTPGGMVTIYVVSRTPRDFESRVTRRASIVRDDDRDGVVQYDNGGPIALKTISFAADLTSGAFAVATPDGHRAGTIPINQRLRSYLAPGRTTIDPAREFYDLVIVRPANGAWHGIIGDGGINDSDRTMNGAALAALAELRPAGNSSAPPPALQRGDIVLIIDSRRMDVVADQIQ